jgi:hypothetical protein
VVEKVLGMHYIYLKTGYRNLPPGNRKWKKIEGKNFISILLTGAGCEDL